MASLLGGMQEGMKEAAKKQVEDQLAEQAPPTLKPFFPCLGGPVNTMETCICMVPADQQDSVKQSIEKYKSMWGCALAYAYCHWLQFAAVGGEACIVLSAAFLDFLWLYSKRCSSQVRLSPSLPFRRRRWHVIWLQSCVRRNVLAKKVVKQKLVWPCESSAWGWQLLSYMFMTPISSLCLAFWTL